MTACSIEAGLAAGILKISLGSDEQPGSLFLRHIHQVGSASAAYTPKPRANLVAQHSDFDWLGQAVRLTPAEFWDQRGVRYRVSSHGYDRSAV